MNDPILVTLNKAVEDGLISEIAVTLTVNGMLITGIICSRTRYEVEVERAIGNSAGAGYEEVIAAIHSGIRENERGCWEQDLAMKENFEAFVHLFSAQVFTNGVALQKTLPWRCKLSSVDAFSIGQVSSQLPA